MTRSRFETRAPRCSERQHWNEHATVRKDALRDAPFKLWLRRGGATLPVLHARFWCNETGLRSYFPPTHMREFVLHEHAAQCAARQMWHAAASGDFDRLRALCTDGVVVQWACNDSQPKSRSKLDLECAPTHGRPCASLQLLSCSLGPLHRIS